MSSFKKQMKAWTMELRLRELQGWTEHLILPAEWTLTMDLLTGWICKLTIVFNFMLTMF